MRFCKVPVIWFDADARLWLYSLYEKERVEQLVGVPELEKCIQALVHLPYIYKLNDQFSLFLYLNVLSSCLKLHKNPSNPTFHVGF